jgi:hypothetical protein
MSSVADAIDKKIGEVRVKELDLTFGELMSLHESQELVISPDYQRLFRWSEEQISRFIESILVELPIPQIFLVENDDGVLELVDGLQRLSSVVHFVNPSLLDSNRDLNTPFKLTGCDLVEELNGLVYEELPLRLRLHIKRYPVRTIMIRRLSSHRLRFEMFKRLNTGGTLLSHQEIRNCSARMVGAPGIQFYEFLRACASSEEFLKCIEPLSEGEREQKADEELVLRFFTLKNALDLFRGSVSDWLTGYMDSVILEETPFNYAIEKEDFENVFSLLRFTMADEAFVRFRGGKPIGTVAPAFFEGVTMGVLKNIDWLKSASPNSVRAKMVEIRDRLGFIDNVGPGANTKGKLMGRIEAFEKGLPELRE